MNNIYLSLGSNQGDRVSNIKSAISLLDQKLKIIELNTSALYETNPVGFISPNKFLNGVVQIKIAAIDPEKLLNILKEIEHEIGRDSNHSGQYMDRPIDLDIILFDNLQISTPKLIIPHPRFRERLFVLIPLLELNPELKDPITGKPITSFLDNPKLKKQDITKFEKQ